MSNQKRRRGKVIYTFALCVWGLLLSAAAVYALGKVWEYAEEYELSRPAHTMDEYVAQLSENFWGEGIEETIQAMPHEVQSDEDVAIHVREMLADGVSYVRKGGSGAVINYSLRCNGNEFGTVTLMEDLDYVGKIDTSKRPWNLLPWRIRPWKVTRESFDFDGLYSPVEVVVPEEYTVLLNGVKLGKQYIVEEGIHYDVLEKYYDLFDDLPTKVRYRFENAIGRIEPEILDEDGEPFVIVPTRDDSQFIKSVTEEKMERLAEFTAGFVVNYLKYTSGVVDPQYGYQKLSFYLVINADLDKRMKDAMDGLSWAHTASITVDSSQLNGALYLGESGRDQYYMLDITAKATTYTVGKGEVENTSNMRVLVRERNDDIRAISLELY